MCNRYREVIAERIQQIKVGKGSESAQRCAALREQDQLCQDNIRLWKEESSDGVINSIICINYYGEEYAIRRTRG